MVKSDLHVENTQINDINTKWYLQRLKSLTKNSQNNQKTNLEKQDKYKTFHIPKKSNEKQISKQNKSLPVNHRNSATSFKTFLTSNPNSEDFISNSSNSLTTTILLKDNYSSRRTSFTTTTTTIEQRCQRAYSSNTNTIEKETCSVLGPQICSDCIQIQTRNQLSPQTLSRDSLHQRLTAIALRRFIKNSEKLSDEDLVEMINHEQIQLERKHTDKITNSIITDEEYFDHLSSLLNRYAGESSPYYFRNLNDFARKYQSNKYKRLFLHETPSPQSSNPLFNHKSVEKFDISKKYSYMKRASTIKPNTKCSTPIFIASEQIDPLHLKYRSLQNYSPALNLYEIPEESIHHRTLIGSKYSSCKI